MGETTIKEYITPPRTAMEVFEMLPEGTLAEVINNKLYMSPAPNFEHQDLLGNLHTDMNVFIRKNALGKCIFSPMDVYLGDKNAVQPDILFIATNNLGIVQKGKVKGAPDLIVEALSQDRKHDLETKKKLYEEFGVKEYFIIDPSNKEVFSYFLQGKKFVFQESKKGEIKSNLLKKTFSF
ncbi:MAG: Uma2 family endonuclease [Bacteroidetes bacterium]|nr:Uma2 family endonuclease [Bacteroidota bacterium]